MRADDEKLHLWSKYMEKRGNRACSYRLSSVQIFGFIKGWDQCAFLYEKAVKAGYFDEWLQKPASAALLKIRIYRTERCACDKKDEGGLAPSKVKKNDGFHLALR